MEFKSREKLLYYARTLEGRTINDAVNFIPPEFISEFTKADEAEYKIEYKGKGGFGDFLEERFFHKKNDSESRPDFPELAIELKASPLKKLQDGTVTVKERLVLNHFRFVDIVKESFDTSKFVSKNAHLLLVFYFYMKDSVDYGNFKIDLVDIWDTLLRDSKQLEEDWNTIVAKVRRGEAHLLSEGDTVLLGACTKGGNKEKSMQKQPYSNIPAPGRALCLKSSYIKSIYKTLAADRENRHSEKSLQTGKVWKPLDVLLHERLDRYFGICGAKIARITGTKFNPKDKSRYARLMKPMLGLQKDENYHEFEAGNIQVKSVRIEANGKVNEAMSFRNIYFKDIVTEDWEDSLFYEELTSKFIFMFFRKKDKDDDDYVFDGFVLWNMPVADLETAQVVWEDTRNKIMNGDYKHFINASKKRIAHVRPKGRNGSSLMETPQGTFEKKKCFWLNNEYIQEIVDNRTPFRPLVQE